MNLGRAVHSSTHSSSKWKIIHLPLQKSLTLKERLKKEEKDKGLASCCSKILSSPVTGVVELTLVDSQKWYLKSYAQRECLNTWESQSCRIKWLHFQVTLMRDGSKVALDESNSVVKLRGSLLVETISLLPRCVIVTDMLGEWLNLSCGDTKWKLLKIHPEWWLTSSCILGGIRKQGDWSTSWPSILWFNIWIINPPGKGANKQMGPGDSIDCYCAWRQIVGDNGLRQCQ